MNKSLAAIAKERRTLVLSTILALPPILFAGSLVTAGGCSPEGCSASAHLATSNPSLFLLGGFVILVIAYSLTIAIIFSVQNARL